MQHDGEQSSLLYQPGPSWPGGGGGPLSGESKMVTGAGDIVEVLCEWSTALMGRYYVSGPLH